MHDLSEEKADAPNAVSLFLGRKIVETIHNAGMFWVRNRDDLSKRRGGWFCCPYGGGEHPIPGTMQVCP